MNILIIEDEAILADRLVRLIREARPDAHIFPTLTSIQDSMAFLAEHPDVDIIFSDIRLDDGLSFSIFSQIEISAKIIFTTAYDEYALRAFEYNCLDYLMKPVRKGDLEVVFKKYDSFSSRSEAGNVKPVMNSMLSGNIPYRRRLLISHAQYTLVVRVEEICFIQTEGGYTKVYCENGNWGTISCSLHKIQEELDPSVFFFANRQTLVNIEYVSRYTSGSGRHVNITMKEPYSNVRLEISSDRAKEMLNLLDG